MIYRKRGDLVAWWDKVEVGSRVRIHSGNLQNSGEDFFSRVNANFREWYFREETGFKLKSKNEKGKIKMRSRDVVSA